MVLRPVDESAEPQIPVVRLESDDPQRQPKPIRLEIPAEQAQPSLRLDIQAPEAEQLRSYEPGIEALIETETFSPDTLEKAWGDKPAFANDFPWGWFVLFGILLAGAVLWSLQRVEKAEIKSDHLRVDTQSAIKKEADQQQQASQDIDQIEVAIRDFFTATTLDSMARLVRQPERVRPLMVDYYAKRPLVPNRLIRTKLLQPLTLDNRANFWVANLELSNQQTRNLIIEILDSGAPKIDWETFVCYQPMPWDDFARERPNDTSFIFRVYIEPDSFFSHEFKDDSQWSCFHLTALDSDETLFGYARINSPESQQILDLLSKNPGKKTSVILRVMIPAGLQSKRGMVIEKLMSPRWLYLDPPDSGS